MRVKAAEADRHLPTRIVQDCTPARAELVLGQGLADAISLTCGGMNDSSIRIEPELQAALRQSGLRSLVLGGRELLPIVQGGMGVGVSAHRLAGTVAACGGVGTLSAIDLRRLHPDLMERTRGRGVGPEVKAAMEQANLEALGREIAAARQLSGGRGLLAVNVMRAVGQYAAYVRRALECGIDAVVVGAGLPLDLPELAAGHPGVALVPILSDARGVQLVLRKWERRKRVPDAIVLEHPALAGGHLGAATVADLRDPRFDFERCVPETLAVLRAAGLERTPIIAAGATRMPIATGWAAGAARVAIAAGAARMPIAACPPPPPPPPPRAKTGPAVTANPDRVTAANTRQDCILPRMRQDFRGFIPSLPPFGGSFQFISERF